MFLCITERTEPSLVPAPLRLADGWQLHAGAGAHPDQAAQPVGSRWVLTGWSQSTRCHVDTHVSIPSCRLLLPPPPTGSLLASKAKNLWQTADVTLANITNSSSSDLTKNTDILWITTNAPRAVFPAYLDSMDGYVQVVIDECNLVNRLHLILLAAEGCVLCALGTAWVWHVSGGGGGGSGVA